MDGATAALKEKLDRLLREAAQVSAALDRADGTVRGVPHYSLIEAQAHELISGVTSRGLDVHIGGSGKEVRATSPPYPTPFPLGTAEKTTNLV